MSQSCKHSWEFRREAGISIKQIAQQAMNENGQKIFEILRQGEEKVCFASLGQMERAVERSGGVGKEVSKYEMQEVKVSSGKQEILKGMIEDKIRWQSRATENITNSFLRR